MLFDGIQVFQLARGSETTQFRVYLHRASTVALWSRICLRISDGVASTSLALLNHIGLATSQYELPLVAAHPLRFKLTRNSIVRHTSRLILDTFSLFYGVDTFFRGLVPGR